MDSPRRMAYPTPETIQSADIRDHNAALQRRAVFCASDCKRLVSKIILSSAVAHLELLNIESSLSSLPRHHHLILESSMLLRVPQGLDRVLQNLARQMV